MEQRGMVVELLVWVSHDYLQLRKDWKEGDVKTAFDLLMLECRVVEV